MAFTTNVPPIQFNATGLVLPAEADILAGVQADINAAFGGGLTQTLTSPQGQIAQSLAAIIGDKNDQVALIANQVDPDQADGRWQDAIGRIYFLDRKAAVGTIVTATCSGLVGTVIPAGSSAQDINGYRYLSLANATIAAGGSVQVQFQCVTTGPIVCAIGALNQIYQAVSGWESITNAAAGITGSNVENRTDFEFRRRNSVAANGVNTPQAIYSAVLGVAGVTDAYVIDNPTGGIANTGSTNYPVAAHSIYVAVAGGAAAAIANAIWSKKPPGCDYNGTTTYVITDNVNYVAPYPTYTIKWVTPAALRTYVTVNLVNNASLPSNIVALVQAAVLAAFNGTDGGQRARIGGTIYSGRYYPGVGAASPIAEIISIFVGSTASPTTASLSVGIDQVPTLASSDIVVNLQ